MNLSSFLNKHMGRTAWLFGKGASVDAYLDSPDYQMPDPGAITMAVNEAILVVPEPTYFFAHDLPNIERASNPERHIFGPHEHPEDIDPRVAREFPHGAIAILREGHEVAATRNGIAIDRVFCYRKAQQDAKLLALPPEELAESGALYGESSTIQSACHFAKLVGCSGVVLVGVDGGDGLAKVFQPLQCLKGAWYTKNKGDTHRILEAMGMPFRVWEG